MLNHNPNPTISAQHGTVNCFHTTKAPGGTPTEGSRIEYVSEPEPRKSPKPQATGGAIIITVGFWGPLYCNYSKEPTKRNYLGLYIRGFVVCGFRVEQQPLNQSRPAWRDQPCPMRCGQLLWRPPGQKLWKRASIVMKSMEDRTYSQISTVITDVNLKPYTYVTYIGLKGWAEMRFEGYLATTQTFQ